MHPDEQFHLLVDAVRDYAIFMLDPTGLVTTWNPGAVRIKGYAPEEIIGRSFTLFYSEEDLEHGVPAAGLAQALKHGRYESQGWRLRRDGTRFFADVVITPVFKADQALVGFAKVTRDITERRKLEDVLRQRVDELAEADRRKDEYLAMLAHELRNPLAPISTGLSVIQRAAVRVPALDRTLQVMDRQLKLMARLVDDLLDVSRITRGKIELRRSMIKLDGVVDQAVEAVLPVIEQREQKLHLECERGIDLYCDLQRLVQALGNVLNNASKYTERAGRIHLSAARRGSEVEITVKDNGIGIRSEMLERIFDTFSQDQRAVGTEMQSGLGIGLTLTRTLIAMHGGRVTATSDGPGKGSCFEIRLPLDQVGDHEGIVERLDRRFRILVVDDNRDAADTMCDLLKIEGYSVETAYGGVEALRKAEEVHFHMILLDLLMPDLTGYEVIRRVRRNPGGPVIVAVTGYGASSDRDKVREAGFDEHIVKPVVGESVLAVVRRFLGGPELQPGLSA